MRSRSKVQRGSTLIELLLVAALQVIVIGAVATLYLFMVQQCGQATAAVGPTMQANAAMDAIEKTIRESMVCAVKTQSGVSGLQCTLPANSVDTDGDGTDDQWLPDKFGGNGKPTYSKGTRVWFYRGDSTGAFGTTGTILWRATRTDDGNPTASDADKSWALYYNGNSRYSLVDSVAFSIGSYSTVAVTIAASASARKPDASGTTATNQDKQAISLAQTIPWRTDFE